MATSVVDRLLVQIEANAAQLQAELAKAGQSTKQFGKETEAIGQAANGIGQRYGQAAVQIASAAENMARAGKVGGEGLKQIITQGSNMAFLFGPQGAIVGAVGIGTLAILEYFRSTEDETRKIVEEVQRLAKSAGAVSLQAAKGRVDALTTSVSDLQQKISSLEERKTTSGGAIGRTEIQSQIDAARAELKTVQEALGNAEALRTQEENRAQAERLRNLRSLVSANRASIADTLKVKEIEGQLREELRKVTLSYERRVEILGLLGELEKRQTSTGGAEKSRAAELEIANRALDDIAKKRSESDKAAIDNSKAVRDAISAASRELAALAGDAVAVLTQQITETTDKFRALGASDDDIAKIVAPLEAARKAATALNGAARTITIPESVRKELGLLPKELEVGTEGAASASLDLARGFSDALDVALGIATAIDGASDSTTRLISAAAQAASGFAKLAELAEAAGGLGALLGGAGGGALAALPAIGSIVGGIASLVGGGKDEAAAQLQRETNARLKELTAKIGDLINVSTSGRDLAGVARAIGTSGVNLPESQGRFDVPADQIERVKKRLTAFDAELKKLDLTMTDVEAIAKQLGVPFDKSAKSFKALREAILSADLSAFTKGFSGAIRRLEIEAAIDPKAFDGISGIIKRLQVLTGPDGAPAIEKALEGINVNTSEGRAAAIAKLGETLRNVQNLKLEDLGGLSLDQFVEEILAAIKALRDVEPPDVAPADKFAKAIEAFGVAVELGTLTAQEKLDKATALFKDLFPDLAAGIDTSSADSFKASIASIIDGFAADGELTDAENAQIAVLRALLAAFEGATPAAEQLVDALSVLEDRFAIFGTAAAQQITDILASVTGDASVGKNAGFALLKGLTDGLDLATDAGQAELRARAQAIFDALSEGGVTAQEQAVVEILKRILGLATDVADEAAKAAADAAAQVEALAEAQARRRRALLDGAETQIDLNDITDPAEQLRIRLEAIGKAFPELADTLDGFDVKTQAGRDALEAWIRSIAGSPEALDSLAQAMGITVDELLSALLGLEEGADAATEKVATLADALGQAFDAADFEAELENITDPLQRLTRTAAKVGDALPELAAIFKQFDLATAEGRAGAEAALIALGKNTTDAAVRTAVLKLLSQIRGVQVAAGEIDSGSTGINSAAAAASRANVAAAASISEVTGNRLVDLFGRNVAATESMRDALLASLGRALSVPSPIAPPALPSLAGGVAQSASAGGIVLQVTLPQIVFAGPVTTADPDELSRLIQSRFVDLMQSSLATELIVALRRAGLARSN